MISAMPMSDETRRRLEAIKAHREDKEPAILAAFDEGAGLREIARALDMTHPAIKYIIEKNRPEAS